MIRRVVVSVVSAALGLGVVAMPVSVKAQMPGVVPGVTVPVGVPRVPVFKGQGSGQLTGTTKDGKAIACPLKHTDVTAKVVGHVSRVTVKQKFSNSSKEKIEALYTFPLSDTGAVDEMLMKVGERTVRGAIKKKEEAREIYEHAKAHCHVASLLDQERANIFTQSVANIEPGKDVEVTITYVDLLPYEAGTYTFAFPTVVGPRFSPPIVSDVAKITPPVAAEGERAGHDISISVSIDSPVAVSNVRSQLHDVKANARGERHYDVSLVNKATIPNKDFVLSWAVATDEVKSGCLTNAKDGEGFFNLSIMPPKKPKANQVQPKEMVFLIDCSGSQSGAPLQKCKDVMHYALDHMNDDDTFQVISFSSVSHNLFAVPQKATADARKKARAFIDGLQANGGTWMEPAVRKACSMPPDEHRLRIVSFMTDGFVGNDMQIIGLIHQLRGTSRWFPFGTGNSVNRFLIDNIAKEGGGEADYVYLNASADAVGKKFYDKIASPVLTDVKVDYDGLAVKEVFPKDPSDVWAERPLYITGRYTKPGKGTVTISGYSGGKPYTQKLAVEFPANNAANDVLGSVWARAKVDRLMAEDWLGAQQGAVNKELKEEIIRTALEHHIMTQYTSFVAVEEKVTTPGGKPVTVQVPVELPDGVSRAGVFGESQNKAKQASGFFHGAYAGSGGGAGVSGMLISQARPVPSSPGALTFNSAAPQMVTARINGKMMADRRTQNESGIAFGDESEAKKDSDKLKPQNLRQPQQYRKREVSSVPQFYAVKLGPAVKRWIDVEKATGEITVRIKLTEEVDLEKLFRNAGAKIVKYDLKGKEAVVKVRLATLYKIVAMRQVASLDKVE